MYDYSNVDSCIQVIHVYIMIQHFKTLLLSTKNGKPTEIFHLRLDTLIELKMHPESMYPPDPPLTGCNPNLRMGSALKGYMNVLF